MPSFQLWIPGVGGPQQSQIHGNLEPPVMAALLEHSGFGKTLWNIGAAWGYFAFAAAAAGSKVIAFEADPFRAKKLRQSAKKNRFAGFEIVEGIVGDDVRIDDMPAPDVVLMDVEGWEYDVLQSCPKTIAAQPVWIIELHNRLTSITPGSPTLNPDGVVRLLQDSGSSVAEIHKRGGETHILALPN